MRLAAALALYTILSLAPLLVITTKVVSVVYANNATEKINAQLTSLMGSEAATAVQHSFIQNARAGRGLIATIISVGILLFSATGVFAELQDSMNTIWGVKPKPNQGIWDLVRNRLLSLAMVFGIGFLLLVSMFVSMILTGTATFLFGKNGWIAHAGDVIISVGVLTLLFAAIFRFLPDVKLAWRHVWLGAVMTACLFTVGKYGLALYFNKALPTSAFGAAGAPVAVLLWVYYSAFILFFGAEFTKVWSLHHGHRVIPEECAVKVTEEDRARQGIPSERRMEKALAGKPFNRLPPPKHLPRSTSNGRARLGPAGYALAASGALAGAIAGGVGGHFMRRNGAAGSAEGWTSPDRLKERLRAIEDQIGYLSRVERRAKTAAVVERIQRVEKALLRVGPGAE